MTSILDHNHLKDYTGGDRALIGLVLTTFLDNAPVYLDDLRRAMDSNSFRTRAHRLKGAARAIGAHALAAAALRAEEGAYGDGPARQRLLAQVEKVFDPTRQAADQMRISSTS